MTYDFKCHHYFARLIDYLAALSGALPITRSGNQSIQMRAHLLAEQTGTVRSGAYSNPATSRTRRSGFVIGAKRARTTPALSTRNFVKFHFMLLPSNPPFCCLSQTYRGWAFLPLTSILANSGKVTP